MRFAAVVFDLDGALLAEPLDSVELPVTHRTIQKG